jgi:hypothetical protein
MIDRKRPTREEVARRTVERLRRMTRLLERGLPWIRSVPRKPQ